MIKNLEELIIKTLDILLETLGRYLPGRFIGGRHCQEFWGQEIGQLKDSSDKGLHSGPSAWGRICSVPCCACGVIFQESFFILTCPNVAAAEVYSVVSLFNDVAKLVNTFVNTHRFNVAMNEVPSEVSSSKRSSN